MTFHEKMCMLWSASHDCHEEPCPHKIYHILQIGRLWFIKTYSAHQQHNNFTSVGMYFVQKHAIVVADIYSIILIEFLE